VVASCQCRCSSPSPTRSEEGTFIGVFEFIVLVVLISTIGKVLTARQSRRELPGAKPQPEEILQLNDAVGELNARLEKLEEERDFYRALLEPPDRGGTAPPPTPPASPNDRTTP